MIFYSKKPFPTASESWIVFDILKRKVSLTSYALRSSDQDVNNCYHAKLWWIVGSNDREKWEVVDQLVNNQSLNGKYKQNRFECSMNDKYYRYIWYIQEYFMVSTTRTEYLAYICWIFWFNFFWIKQLLLQFPIFLCLQN